MKSVLIGLLMLALSSCATVTPQPAISAKYEADRAQTQAIHNEYADRLANDPELAIIRGKSGISFTGNPLDNFDNNYPTQDELVAIKKYGRLMEEYFGKLCKNEMRVAQESTLGFEQKAIGMALAQDNCARWNAHVQAVVALHSGRLTWAQFGRTAIQIDSAPQQGFRNALQRQGEIDRQRAEALRAEQEKREREFTEERRHQEILRQQSAPRSTTCTPGSGGAVHCSTY